MGEPLIAGRKPCLVTLPRKGRTVWWCACGRSRNQPFCDGSHAGSGFEPVPYVARADGEEVLLCACKRTRRPPFCDGSHNALAETYEEASEAERRATADIPVAPPRDGKAVLDGGAFVLTLDPGRAAARDGWCVLEAIGAADGARHLAQVLLLPGEGARPLAFGTAEVALFVRAGAGVLTISGRPFAVEPETALHLRPGETLGVAKGRPEIVATICPLGPMPMPAQTAGAFDDSQPARAFGVDPSRRAAMADRFYQVLVGEETGSREVTVFIGEIPRSRAAAHRHMYEEAILILSGSGFLWTEAARAAVAPGDLVFLPRKQLHSLECTDPAGMRLAGAFYPAGSPAVNY